MLNPTKIFPIYKLLPIFPLFLIFAPIFASAQLAPGGGLSSDSIALAPARVELEMKPGSETTFVINLDYRSNSGTAKPARIAASINDWSIAPNGQVEFSRPGAKQNSAASWIVYSPAETIVTPGQVHSIRVTVSVPADAAPGDHLAALVVEQRPDTLKFNQTAGREMIVRYRMASVFYIKVGQLTKRGSLENLRAQINPKGIEITSTFKNAGNSAVRPTASIEIVDAAGKIVAALPQIEPLPILGNSQASQTLLVENRLPPGVYTVKYLVDFQDGAAPTQGITDLLIEDSKKKITQIATGKDKDNR